MMDQPHDYPSLATEEQRDLTLVAALVGVIIVAGGLFIFNSTSAQYTTASYKAPPLAGAIPVMTPSSVPLPNAAPSQ